MLARLRDLHIFFFFEEPAHSAVHELAVRGLFSYLPLDLLSTDIVKSRRRTKVASTNKKGSFSKNGLDLG